MSTRIARRDRRNGYSGETVPIIPPTPTRPVNDDETVRDRSPMAALVHREHAITGEETAA